jgi:hypothetical protein
MVETGWMRGTMQSLERRDVGAKLQGGAMGLYCELSIELMRHSLERTFRGCRAAKSIGRPVCADRLSG